MNKDKQWAAIAEACGWKHHDATSESPVIKGGMRLPNYFENRDTVDAWTHANEPGVYCEPPRYLTDLNAMHEAEKVFYADAKQSERYADFLLDVFEMPSAFIGTARCAFLTAHATAAQRAEAFLRTIGKWEND